MSDAQTPWVRELTWQEFRDAAKSDKPFVVLLPVGSVEPHGPHLPLGTDTAISDGVALAAHKRLSDGHECYIAPPVPYGVTECAGAFAGAVTVEAATLTEFLAQVIRGYLHHGVDHVCVVNNHLEPGQDQAIRAASSQFEPGQSSVACPLTRRWGRTLSPEFKSGACHAGRYETSIVLAHEPATVRDEIRDSLPEVPISLSEKLLGGVSDFCEMGLTEAYAGAPAAATKEEGRELIALLAEMVVTEVCEALAEDAS